MTFRSLAKGFGGWKTGAEPTEDFAKTSRWVRRDE